MRNIGHKFILIAGVVFSISVIALIILLSSQRKHIKEISVAGGWHSIQRDDICYIVSFPIQSEGDYSERNAAYLTITHRPKKNITGEIAFHAGYSYADSKKAVTLNVDEKKFKLIPRGEWAWPKNADEDARIIQAMIAGEEFTVKGYMETGILTTDTFTLNGMIQSLEEINSACRSNLTF